MSTQTFIVEELQKNDYFNGHLQLLSQLTITNPENITFEQFCDTYDKQIQQGKKIFVVRDNKDKIIATASLIIEQKFTRDLSKAGHIEDVVTDREHRKKGLGKLLVDYCKNYASQQGCYKTLLNCSDDNAPFYEKCLFEKKDVGMACYF